MMRQAEGRAAMTLLAQAAGNEFEEVAQCEPPEEGVLANLAVMAMICPGASLLRCCMPPFWGAMVTLGGLERGSVLLLMARIDANHSSTLDDAEVEEFEKAGNKLCSSVADTLGSLSIVGTLLFGATHLATIGRPVPWRPTEEAIEAFGREVAARLMGAAYITNVLVEGGALALVIVCIWYKIVLTTVLPSLESKLSALINYNMLNRVMTLIALTATVLLFVLVPLGGILSSPRWGFATLGVAPLTFAMIVWMVAPVYVRACIRLHHESKTYLSGAQLVGLEAGSEGGIECGADESATTSKECRFATAVEKMLLSGDPSQRSESATF